jgi:hypothetical protein
LNRKPQPIKACERKRLEAPHPVVWQEAYDPIEPVVEYRDVLEWLLPQEKPFTLHAYSGAPWIEIRVATRPVLRFDTPFNSFHNNNIRITTTMTDSSKSNNKVQLQLFENSNAENELYGHDATPSSVQIMEGLHSKLRNADFEARRHKMTPFTSCTVRVDVPEFGDKVSSKLTL